MNIGLATAGMELLTIAMTVGGNRPKPDRYGSNTFPYDFVTLFGSTASIVILFVAFCG